MSACLPVWEEFSVKGKIESSPYAGNVQQARAHLQSKLPYYTVYASRSTCCSVVQRSFKEKRSLGSYQDFGLCTTVQIEALLICFSGYLSMI